MSNVALPIASQNKQGNVHINQEHQQIRYQVEPDKPGAWVHPLSAYRAGKSILRGQPVSIAFKDELPTDALISGEPCVVPTDPHKHNWCIGVALEPGFPDTNPDPNVDNSNYVHVLASGKLKFNKSETRQNCFQPPMYVDSQGRQQFVWTYEDIGKSVYVSNVTGHVGELTLDVTEAYANGANIITIGHLADAPTAIDATHPDPHGTEIIIEVQLDGDNRGLIDSTEFSLELLPNDPSDPNNPPDIQNTGSSDRLICVKIVKDANGVMKGKMILNNETLLENGAQQSPVGAFLAEPGKNYKGQSVVVYRLGIVEGHDSTKFTWSANDFGKDIYLSNGFLTTMGSDSSFEYKVGVVISENRVLVDCRYARVFSKFEPIGKIKPLYDGTNTDPGFMIIDPTQSHDCANYYDDNADIGLLTVILYQDIADFFDQSGNPIDMTLVNGAQRMSCHDFMQNYPNSTFKFKEMLYEFNNGIGGTAARTQIKFSTEGSPDNIQYVWPSKVFQVQLTPALAGGSHTVAAPAIKLDITDLVNSGETIGGGSAIVDDYIATIILQKQGTSNPFIDLHNVQLSSGYYTVTIRSEVTYQDMNDLDTAGNPKIKTDYRNDPYLCGYEWVVIKETVANPSNPSQIINKYFMCAITDPGNLYVKPSGTGPTWYPPSSSPITSDHVLGICYPPGKQVTEPLTLSVLVRRRPTFYHDLLLNQLYSDDSWRGSLLFDGNNLGVNSTIYFDHVIPTTIPDPNNPGQTLPYIDTSYSNSLTIKSTGYNPTDLSFSDPNRIYKIMDIVYGPQVVGANISGADFAVERHQAMPTPVVGPTYKPIDWRYDFIQTRIETNASMAAKYSFPDTQSAPNPPSSIPFKTKIYELYGDDGKTPTTAIPHTVKPRSALKTLHEIPTLFFTYLDDDFNTKKIIGAAQRGFFPVGTGTGATIEMGTDATLNRPIFQGVVDLATDTPDPAITTEGMYYTYETDPTLTGVDRVEWELMQEELDYVFNFKEFQDVANTPYWRAVHQVQSNVGLLNRGAREAQDRLLRLERSLFGADYSEIPNHTITTQQVYDDLNNNGLNLIDAQTNPGVLRLTKYMFDNEVVFEGLSTDPNDLTGLNSYYQDMYYEIFGNYETLNLKFRDVKAVPSLFKTLKNLRSDGKVHYAWLFANDHGADTLTVNDIKNTGFKPSNVGIGLHDTASIYVHKSEKPYGFPIGGNDKFVWPLIKELPDETVDGYMFGYYPPSFSFYDNNTFGMSDGASSLSTTGAPATFASQSVEGYLYDIVLKLNYIRNCFSTEARSIMPEYSLMSSIKSDTFAKQKVKAVQTTVSITYSEPIAPAVTTRAKNPFDYTGEFNIPEISGIDHNVFTALQFDNFEESRKISRFGISKPVITENSLGLARPSAIMKTLTNELVSYSGTLNCCDSDGNAQSVSVNQYAIVNGNLLVSDNLDGTFILGLTVSSIKFFGTWQLSKEVVTNITYSTGSVGGQGSGTFVTSINQTKKTISYDYTLAIDVGACPVSNKTISNPPIIDTCEEFNLTTPGGSASMSGTGIVTGGSVSGVKLYVKVPYSSMEALGLEVNSMTQGIRLLKGSRYGDMTKSSTAKFAMSNHAYFNTGKISKKRGITTEYEVKQVLLVLSNETIQDPDDPTTLDNLLLAGQQYTISFLPASSGNLNVEWALYCNNHQVAGAIGNPKPTYTFTPDSGMVLDFRGVINQDETSITSNRTFTVLDTNSAAPLTFYFGHSDFGSAAGQKLYINVGQGITYEFSGGDTWLPPPPSGSSTGIVYIYPNSKNPNQYMPRFCTLQLNLKAGATTIVSYNILIAQFYIDQIPAPGGGPTMNVLSNKSSGSYTLPTDVALFCPTQNAVIYYTIDGSTPTDTSTVYSGPITVAAATTIKAVAKAPGKTISGVTVISIG